MVDVIEGVGRRGEGKGGRQIRCRGEGMKGQLVVGRIEDGGGVGVGEGGSGMPINEVINKKDNFIHPYLC